MITNTKIAWGDRLGGQLIRLAELFFVLRKILCDFYCKQFYKDFPGKKLLSRILDCTLIYALLRVGFGVMEEYY